MVVAAIRLRAADGSASAVSAAYAEPGLGLRGGAPPRKADRELSLLAGELLPGLRALGGLCTERFDADLRTEGLDYATLRAGDRLRLGEATLVLTAVGKRCFDECPLRQRGERCPLPRGCAFARVERGGAIALGDEVALVREGANG